MLGDRKLNCRGHYGGNPSRIGQGSQLDEPYAVGVSAQQLSRQRRRQAGLANASGAGECHETVSSELEYMLSKVFDERVSLI